MITGTTAAWGTYLNAGIQLAAGSNGSTGTGQNFLYYTGQTTAAANLSDMTTDMNNIFNSLALIISNFKFSFRFFSNSGSS